MKTEQVSTTEMLANDLAGGVTDAIQSLGGLQMADYELTERLGAGGYGEVWKAIGPGGLPKAVKILYGERDGDHASAELKSLERMRDLRHPFLLSIERIEVVNSRLIVVTELADGNLSERFEACRREGKQGIPRDELLGYLRDSADALDFMAEQHNLQHLDIKPDNLLLQGSHVKVGDFGLAKDISTTNVSVLNGFTPMFAAPELFEGRPGRASDQYSLAVVYQLMLTGNAPFNGRTAAQLTAQHLRSQPDLTFLEPIDRPVIARALSKNINSRFDSCRQFIDELSRRKVSRSKNVAFIQGTDATDVSATQLLKTQLGDSAAVVPKVESTPVAANPASTENAALRSSVVIGVGGLAGLVLKSFKNRIVAKSESQACPFPILQLDTDRDTLTDLKLAGDEVGLAAEETLAIPLRSSNDYRSASELDLSWLSRRWLFNIPRTGKVDGIRPLGRLALCDHKQTVAERLSELLTEVFSDEVREAASGLTEFPLADHGLDVYVVAATSGGTSSGALSDVGLMVKHALRLAGIEDGQVNGVLMHGTSVLRNVAELQEANTVCALRELRQHSTPGLGSKRGFEKAGVQADVAPFDNVSLVHFGDGLNEDGFLNRTQSIGEHLFNLVTTAAQLDFREWRQASNEEATLDPQLSVLGVDSLDSTTLSVATEEAGNLTAELLKSWGGHVARTDVEKQTELPVELTDTETLLTELNLTHGTLSEQVVSLLRGEVGRNIEAYAADVNLRLDSEHNLDSVTRGQVLDFLSQQLSQKHDGNSPSLHSIISDVQSRLSVVTGSCQKAVEAHLYGLLDSPHRLNGASAACKYTVESLFETQQGCEVLLGKVQSAFNDLTEFGEAESGFSSADEVTNFCKQYCIMLAYQTIHQCFVNHVSTILKAANTVSASLASLRLNVESAAKGVVDSQSTSEASPQPVVDAFDKYIRSTVPTMLSDYAAKDPENAVFASELMTLAQRFLVAKSDGSAATETQSGVEPTEFPMKAWPFYRNAGGRRRVLAQMPSTLNTDEWQQKLKDSFGDCVVVRSTQNSSISIACEISEVQVESILTRMTVGNPHVSDVADRIHTRTDIDW